VIGYPSRQGGSILRAWDNPACPARKHFAESQIINPLWTKLVPSRWLGIAGSFFAS